MLLLSTHLAGPRRRAACEHRRPLLESDPRGHQSNTYGELATYVAKYGSNTLYALTYDSNSAHRDALGRVVQKTETLRGVTHTLGYTYDVQGRLTDVTRDGTLIEHYDYDLNGNRKTATVNGTTVNPTYDDQDRLLTYGDTTFTYTANGEVRTKTDSSGTTTYTYDAMGSLIAVSLPDGRLVEYVTDGKGRRIGKMVNGVLTKHWLYRDQLKPVAELDGAGNIISEFIYGTKVNVPDLVVRGGLAYRIVTDQLGSPVLAINTANSSDVPFQATYAAFGERTLVAGTDDWMPFGFAGGIYDPDTKLSRFGARDYDPMIGRWISKDPSLFAARGVNLYQYAMNNPVNFADMTGRDVCVYSSSQGYHHQWLGFNGDSSQTYGFWPGGNPFGGPGQLLSPDGRADESSDPGTTATCRQSSAAEDEQLKDWIKQTYPINQLDSQHHYFFGISDCRAFTGEAMRQMDAIQGNGPSLTDILWAFW